MSTTKAQHPNHDHQHPHQHPHVGALPDHSRHDRGFDHVLDRRTLLMTGAFGLGAALLAACGVTENSIQTTGNASTTSPGDAASGSVADTAAVGETGTTLAGFDAFADSVRAFTSGDVWLVETNSLPSHQMMVGITSWQQQLPVTQNYTGNNAWQFPIVPQLAAEPVSARTGLFRGAIALAVNGVPIFNALNNRGDDAFLVGELDNFGGHCGRADDYHYHVAPLHLEEIVGPTNPIAYALDGFALYGSVEPDGSPLEDLDEYNGHVGSDGIYHYHGTTTYPYINGGLVGVVQVSDQVEPQPVTPAFRPALEPLVGATIIGFEETADGTYFVEYTLDDAIGTIEYTVTDTTVTFEFTSPTGAITTETYNR